MARYGGEEFVAILPTAAEKKGVEVAERMRNVIAKSVLKVAKGKQLEITVSIGVSTFVVEQPGLSKAIDKAVLIEVADKALYAAKNAGRNQVISGGEVKSIATSKARSAAKN